MIVGVDASNLRAGGGITHLTNLVAVAEPRDFGIERVILWANRNTLAHLPDAVWLEKVHEPLLDRALPFRLYWQWFRLPRLVDGHCQILFSPGGNAPPSSAPLVTMSRNMLPFEYRELFRYGVSWMTVRLLLLRLGQSRTFRRAEGLIFLTGYAHDAVRRVAGVPDRVAIIPHGVEERFRCPPREQHALDAYCVERPFRLLYVSIVDVYKHQWHVAEAVRRLRDAGLPVVIDFVGPGYGSALGRLKRTLRRLDPGGAVLRHRGAVPFAELHRLREEADLFVFASSCENMPNILLEAMAAGYPIVCARRGPMPEMLGEGGLYFDPEKPAEIAEAIETLVRDPDLRARCARAAFERAASYSWERCARETLSFIRDVAAAPTG